MMSFNFKSRLSYKVLVNKEDDILQYDLQGATAPDEQYVNNNQPNYTPSYAPSISSLDSPNCMTTEETTRLTAQNNGSEVESTTVPKAYFNLTVCILASALLSMPYGFDKSGWLGGMVMLVVIGLLVDYTLQCLGAVCLSLDVYDYQEIAEITFGKPGRYIQVFVQLFLSLSLMISYQIIAAENIKNMISLEWVTKAQLDNIDLRYILVPLITILILVPFVTLATLKMLGYSSMISVLAIMILCGALLYFDLDLGATDTVVFSSDFFTGISVFTTGFVCHQIITPTLDSLQDEVGGQTKKQKYHTVIHMAIITSFLFFTAVGAMGYCLCDQGTCPGNILDWSSDTHGSIKDNTVGKVAIAMFLLTALFAYPLEHFSCYNTICKLFFSRWSPPSKLTTLCIKLILVVMTTVPALFIEDIGPLIAWAGTLAAFPLGFLLPLAISVKHVDFKLDGSLGKAKLIFKIFLLFVTGTLMIVHTFTQFAEIYCSHTGRRGNSTHGDG